MTPEPLTAENAGPFFVPGAGVARRELAPGVSIGATAGEGMMISVVDFEADAVVSEHSHHHEQMGIVLLGRLEFTVGGITRVLGPGDLWRIPGGVPHSARALGGPAVALDVFHPVRDDYR